MITVAHLITKLELGGAQENTLFTCRHLDRTRFRVALLHGPGGLLDAETTPETLPNTEVVVVRDLHRAIHPSRDARCLNQLVTLLSRMRRAHAAAGLDPEHFVVHTHSSKAGILGRLAARIARVPRVVHTIHGFGFFDGQPALERASFVLAERAAARFTDAFIGVSRANLAEGIARGIIHPRHMVALIRSGMPLEPYRDIDERRGPARARLGLGPDTEVVLSIGNFKPQKDPWTMIRAMSRLVRDRPRAVLLLSGDGSEREAIEHLIQDLGLVSHVRLLGWRRDIPDLLAACDVVALSSIYEGLPRSAVQAVAARRPFVGTRVDGTSEIIRDGRNGFLIEPRSPEALAHALSRALDERPIDPSDEERLVEWDAGRMVRAQEQLYASLVARPRNK